MPKKKGKTRGDKQGEEKKTPKKDSSATDADKTGFGDKERDIYLNQIRYLEEQLERYQLKCDQLERQNKDFNFQCSALEEDKKDIVNYMKHCLLEKENEVDGLTERLESQRQVADKDRDALQLQHSQLKQQLQNQIKELTEENETIAMRIAGLEEFQKQKEQLISDMESLEQQLASQKEEHKADIHSLEMKALLEKKRLEEEMKSHEVVMVAEVQDLVNQKLPQTTRLALQENEEIKIQLSQLSADVDFLIGENFALRDCNSMLSVEVDNLQEILSKTSRESCIRKKVAEQLTKECQQQQAKLKDNREKFEQLQGKLTGVLPEMETVRQDRASLSEQCSIKIAEVSRLKAELQAERRRRSRMKTIMQEAALTLRQALMMAPTKQDSKVDSVHQWKQLMQNMLVVLDRSTLTNKQLNEPQTSDTAAASDTEDTCDLGPVSRPTLKHKAVRYRTGAESNSTHVPLHRKPSCQKTFSSINATESAVRFLMSRNSFTKPK